jgi:hypothetical protein
LGEIAVSSAKKHVFFGALEALMAFWQAPNQMQPLFFTA